ncbi:hypothetical protein [Actinoplanes sp. NPDC026623]|uniref:hypothetical protein n=1 Tax=Actinoplanes sp. NPDC026623 TaxID=3155610 RepID=UPI0033DABE0D
MSERRTLGDVVELQRGTTYLSRLLGEPGPALLGLGVIKRHGGFKGAGLKTYGGDSAAKLLLRPGDLFLSLKDVTQEAALLGAVARVPDSVPVGRLTQDTVKLTVTDGDVDPGYLYWILRAPQYREYCRQHAVGTTNLSLSREDFLSYPLPPATAARLRLIELFETIEAKIAVNNRIAVTADALRSAMLEHARRERPQDFVALPLSQVAEFVNGRAFTKDATGDGRMVIRIAEINSGPGSSTVYNDIQVDERHLARPGDILFSWSGSLAVARWFRPEAIINQHIFKVIPRGENPPWLAFDAVRSKLIHYRAVAADKATTMGHIQRHHLDEEVLVPGPTATARLDRQAAGLWRRALVAEQESLTLIAFLDTLLPELLPGRLRVRDAGEAA